jgi:hypothetical protein
MLTERALTLDVGEALAHYRAHGYARLGQVVAPGFLEQLRERADDLMLGRVSYPGMFFQQDSPTGRRRDLRLGLGYLGPSLAYRKLEKLELDERFATWLANALFRRITAALIGPEVTLYRAVIFNKGAAGGSEIPWHQDGGRFWGLDREPALQIWTALDDADLDGGCVEVLPASHHDGLATPLGGIVPEAIVCERDAASRALALPARAGEALLIHNHMWHRSDVNRSGRQRRAFTVCYMDAATRCLRKRKAPRQFHRVFGTGAALR